MNLPLYIRKAEEIGEATEHFVCGKWLRRAIWATITFSIIYFVPVIINIIHK